MTWEEFVTERTKIPEHTTIESRVLAKLGSRLREFFLDEVGDQLVLRGKARSYHVKQLAQHEVMAMTNRPILANTIEVHQ